MANPEHLEILMQGVEVWNAWRKTNPYLRPDLSDVDLGPYIDNAVLINVYRDLPYSQRYHLIKTNASRAKAMFKGADLAQRDLSATNFSGADLALTTFKGADLRGANLELANLSWTDLTDAILFRANLSGAYLRSANLTGADLSEANLSHANLRKANLKSTILWKSIFLDTNLTDAKALDECDHHGPCIIDHHTLANSGELPKEFLRGCGLQDWEVESAKLYNPNLTPREITDIQYQIFELRSMKPIQFYTCFISYSAKDKAFAEKLYTDLQEIGVECWFAPKDLHSGPRIHDQITEAIGVSQKLLLVLSRHSMNSEWVATEIKGAVKSARLHGKQMLFPISITSYKTIKEWKLFDSELGMDLAAEIRSYFIPDFSKWKRDPNAYQQAFARFLRDLKAGT